MNRLQKKCVIVTVGVHLLLLVILLVGPAFFSPRLKADDIHVLTVIPAMLVDAPFSSGVANAAPPPEPVAPPTPPPSVPVVAPPPPVKAEREEPVKLPDKVKPVESVKPEPRKIQISTTLVTRSAPKNPSAAAKAQQQQRAKAFQIALQKLNSKLTSGTVVDMPGSGSVAYASYKDALGSIYYDAWTPDGSISDEADALVRITVASDGTVLDARIITRSGDEKMDTSVQRALQRVSSVPALPDKSKVQQEFTIQFNLKAKRMLE
jgi:TonB family protein